MSNAAAMWSCPRCKRRVPNRVDVCRCGEPRPEHVHAVAAAVSEKGFARRLYENWYLRSGILLALALLSSLKLLRLMTP